jgi:hypothetical protein
LEDSQISAFISVMGKGAHLFRLVEAAQKKVVLGREKTFLEQRQAEIVAELQVIEQQVKKLMCDPEAVEVAVDFAPEVFEMFGLGQPSDGKAATGPANEHGGNKDGGDNEGGNHGSAEDDA